MRTRLSTLEPDIENKIHVVDRYVRKKQYKCVFPGCSKFAINGHSIPRALQLAALAENKHVYTHPTSMVGVIHKETGWEPWEIELVGVNQASVFKGFCGEHDRALFRSVETSYRKWHAPQVALHLRGVVFEYSRKRHSRDYMDKLGDLLNNAMLKSNHRKFVEASDNAIAILEHAYINPLLLPLVGGPGFEAVDYVVIPFRRNLKVSTCGMLWTDSKEPISGVCYNLLSNVNVSTLTFTAFRNETKYMDNFLSDYRLSSGEKPEPRLRIDGVERLVNDVAFFHSKEPLIAPPFWNSLTDAERLAARYSMRHPAFRTDTAAPRIIKITEDDLLWMRSELPDPSP